MTPAIAWLRALLPGRRGRGGLRMRVRPGERLLLTLEGTLDVHGAQRVEVVLAEHWTVRRALVVDLRGVTDIDAAGMALLLDIDDRCRLAQATFVPPTARPGETSPVSAFEDRLCWLVEAHDG